VKKPPVVTIMGHVDHGKTTLLDFIRRTKVASKEAGGITQSIGAYQVEVKDKKITFIDTPGHAAFSKMRSMGNIAADIVVIVIAADDGVMPQTREAIDLVKAANTSFIVAINKIDKPSADSNKVKKQLVDNGVLVEGWGGDIVCVEISALTGKNVETLLDVILLLAEMLDLKANFSGSPVATVIESAIDPKRGAVSTAVVREGVLEVGKDVYSQDGQKARVRALIDYKGENVKKAFPGDPVEVLGFKDTVALGSSITGDKGSLETAVLPGTNSRKVPKETSEKQLNLVIKADTVGSLDAIKATLSGIEKEDAQINIILAGVGGVTESDILVAKDSGAIILAFNVRVPKNVAGLAEDLKVIVRSYKIIYELFEEVEGALEGVLELEEEKIKGRAEVIAKFKLPKSGDIIAGCKVLGGRLKVKDKVQVWESLDTLKQRKQVKVEEGPTPLCNGAIKSLKIGKDEVSVAGKDNEAGVLLSPQFPEIKVGNVLEVV